MTGGNAAKYKVVSLVIKIRAWQQWRSGMAMLVALVLFVGMVGVMTSAQKDAAPNNTPDSDAMAVLSNAPQVGSATITTTESPATIDGDALREYIWDWIRENPGQQWAVQVSGVSTDFATGVNEHEQFELASIYKLFLIAPLASKVPSAQWETVSINGQSYDRCVKIMLSLSDNPCAQAIGDSLGWSSINRQLKAAEYKDTDFTGKDFFRSSAYDTALLLKRLHDGEGYDGQTRRIVMEALADQRLRQGIPKGCTDCATWNKTGDWNGNRHDAAIISSGGVTYTLSIMSRGGTWTQIADLTEGIDSRITEQTGNRSTD